MGKRKNALFQFANAKGLGEKIIEDTDLITVMEAEELWNRYYSKFIKNLRDGLEPQMVIWINCKHNTDYHTKLKELDYMDDLLVEDGVIYKRTKERII